MRHLDKSFEYQYIIAEIFDLKKSLTAFGCVDESEQNNEKIRCFRYSYFSNSQW